MVSKISSSNHPLRIVLEKIVLKMYFFFFAGDGYNNAITALQYVAYCCFRCFSRFVFGPCFEMQCLVYFLMSNHLSVGKERFLPFFNYHYFPFLYSCLRSKPLLHGVMGLLAVCSIS